MQWWNEDEFFKTFVPFHPAHDEFTGRKWWGDRIAGYVLVFAGGAAGAGQALAAGREHVHRPPLRPLRRDAHDDGGRPVGARLLASSTLRTAGPPLTLVINKMPRKREARLDLDALERLVPDAHGVVTLGEDQRSATRVANGDYSWDDAPPAWRRSIRELVVTLQADWPGLGITTS